MNVGVVGRQKVRIFITLYINKTYPLSATQTPTQQTDQIPTKHIGFVGNRPGPFLDMSSLHVNTPHPSDNLPEHSHCLRYNKQMAGGLTAEADLCKERIRKFARDKDTHWMQLKLTFP